MGIGIDVALVSKRVGDALIPVLMLRFENSIYALAAVEQFTPPKLMLAEAVDPKERDSLGVTDGDHTFIEIPKNKEWLQNASKIGYFITMVSTEDPNGGDLARVLVVQFPFGHILANPGPMKLSGEDLMSAMSKPDFGSGHSKQDQTMLQKASDLAAAESFAGN